MAQLHFFALRCPWPPSNSAWELLWTLVPDVLALDKTPDVMFSGAWQWVKGNEHRFPLVRLFSPILGFTRVAGTYDYGKGENLVPSPKPGQRPPMNQFSHDCWNHPSCVIIYICIIIWSYIIIDVLFCFLWLKVSPLCIIQYYIRVCSVCVYIYIPGWILYVSLCSPHWMIASSTKVC